ncbi:MAG TPA: HAMP domain-containing sensor histidine kinase [Bacteroidales bacterium]|nr:two-component sensor histidine kinase [Bacteroidales bacterium]HQG36092.1 HAMP domain-containing sensor histidine kinase [Bacteroidales bacterium]HQG52058.1 HAMP domain-containing sensor histidine kinase [Bacteroidales bacterium]HRC88399.1 HAMP domain-containing sensor histidine kinase [Bacteroidales bacterium]
MQIRTRLTLQFLLIGGIIMITASVAIYYLSENYLREDFYNRLENKARNTAKLLLEVEEINADLLKRIEKDNPANLPNEKIIILNYDKDTLYTSDEEGEIKITEDVLERLWTLGRITYRQDPFEVVGLLYAESTNRFAVLAAAIDTTRMLRLKNLRITLIAVCLISLLVFFIAGWFYSHRALKPISDVVKRVEEISITSLNLRLNEGNGTDELARLAKTFNKMLERIETSFMVQKSFIANASHELRTPLTSLNGQIEVLLMKDRSTEEYKKALASILEDIKSLSELANRLLLIARTSSINPADLNAKVRIDEILWQVQDEMKKLHNDYIININLDETVTEIEQMAVAGDESLLKTAFVNVIDNACKYSGDKRVYISLNSSNESIALTFEDNGIGIPQDELNKIYEPFFRGSNVKFASGHGIGLPLTNQIIKAHKGTLKISSIPGKGTTVTIILPVAPKNK